MTKVPLEFLNKNNGRFFRVLVDKLSFSRRQTGVEKKPSGPACCFALKLRAKIVAHIGTVKGSHIGTERRAI